MAFLPQDVVTEILLRLPVICLLKCLCVCKDWYLLIKSSNFVDRHLNHPCRHKNRQDFIVFSGISDSIHDLFYYCLDNIDGASAPIRPSFLASRFRLGLSISGPCNGIFCVLDKSIFACQDDVFLCNPATRESRRLPRWKPGQSPSQRRSCSGISACGLGYDHLSNEYKVVSVLTYGPENSVAYRVGIYSLSLNSWREVETTLPDAMRAEGSKYYKPMWFGGGVPFNGILHWGLEDLETILCFDVVNEVTGHLSLPPTVVVRENMQENYRKVIVLEDCLALAAIATRFDQNEAHSIFIWKMMEYGAKESWMIRFSISIPFQGRDLHPLGFCKDYTLLLLNRESSELISVYNVKEGGCGLKIQKVKDCLAYAVVLLEESLVPLG